MTRKMKKMPAPKKNPIMKRNASQVAVRRKSGGGAMQLLTALVVVVVACAIAYFYYKHARKESAKRAFAGAELYLKRHYDDYPSAILRFRQALAKAKGTDVEPVIADRLDEVVAEARIQADLVKKYNVAKEKAKILVARKKFDEAIELLRASSGKIKDKYLRKEASTRIRMIQMTASRIHK
jgi:predicted metal-dependent hydrolase